MDGTVVALLIVAVAIAVPVVMMLDEQRKQLSASRPVVKIYELRAPSAGKEPGEGGGAFWSQRGKWPIPFQVRYKQVDVETGAESGWSPFYSSSEYSNPVLSIGRYSGDRIIYRQFEGSDPQELDRVPGSVEIWTDHNGAEL